MKNLSKNFQESTFGMWNTCKLNIWLEETEIRILNNMFPNNLHIYKERTHTKSDIVWYCKMEFMCKQKHEDFYNHFLSQAKSAEYNTKAFIKYFANVKDLENVLISE